MVFPPETTQSDSLLAGEQISQARTYGPVVQKIFAAGLRSQIHGMVHCSGGAQTKAGVQSKAGEGPSHLKKNQVRLVFILRRLDSPFSSPIVLFGNHPFSMFVSHSLKRLMPEESGAGTARILKARSQCRFMPFAFCSSRDVFLARVHTCALFADGLSL